MKTKSIWTAADLRNNLVTKSRDGGQWLLCKVQNFNADNSWIFVDHSSIPSGLFNEKDFVEELNTCGHEPTLEPFTFTNGTAQANLLKKVIEWEDSDLVCGTTYRVDENLIYRIVASRPARARLIHPFIGDSFNVDAELMNKEGAVPVTIKFEDQEVQA